MVPEYFDVHAHLNFSAFDPDRDETIKRTLDQGVWVMNVGTQKDTSAKAVELANKHEGLFAAVGLHPIHTSKSYHDVSELGEGGKDFTSRGEQFDYDFYKRLGTEKKVLAIGECGLDYFRATPEQAKHQKDNFVRQIDLANDLRKPLMLHVRNAYKDALRILQTESKVKGDVHFFAGTWEEAKGFLDLGFSLSFTGVITFAHDYDEVIRNTPLEMILAETDCPYVTPAPYRGKRNEPIYVKEVYKRIAEVKKISVETVRVSIISNVSRLFEPDY